MFDITKYFLNKINLLFNFIQFSMNYIENIITGGLFRDVQ